MAVISWMVIKDLGVYQKKDKLDSEVADLKAQIQQVQKSNEELRKGISESASQDYLEKVAREQLDLQKSGEKVVSFVVSQTKSPEENTKSKNIWSAEFWLGWMSGAWGWIKSKF